MYTLGCAANSGQNYTTAVDGAQGFFSFIPNTFERMVAVTWSGNWSVPKPLVTLSLYKHGYLAPLSLAAPTCNVPADIPRVAAFYLNGTTYAFGGNILYRVDPSTVSSDCIFRPIQKLPVSYSTSCSLSFQRHHLAYICKGTLVDLWFYGNDNFTVSSQPTSFTTDWLWMAEDPANGDLYVNQISCCMWLGVRSSPQGNVTWTLQPQWRRYVSLPYSSLSQTSLK